MKKRALCMLLALMMVCALLPMSVFAADLSPYKSVLQSNAGNDVLGVFRDLDGDGTEELILDVMTSNSDTVFVYTIKNGNATAVMNFAFPDSGDQYRYFALVPSGKTFQIVTQEEHYAEASPYEGTPVYWDRGNVQFWKLSGGSVSKTDVMEFNLLMHDDDSNLYFVTPSSIKRNGNTISGDEMNAVFDHVHDNAVTWLTVDDCDGVYPAEQLLNALNGFFQDVAPSAYYAVPVGWAVDNNITKGTSNVNFSPESACTRGQVVTFLWRAAGEPKITGATNPFKDVSPSAYYYDAVLWAVKNNITVGTSATTFSPNASCTRAQVVTFLWRANGETKDTAANPFKDVASGAYYYDAVLWAVKNEVTSGTSSTTFSPDGTCTRAQIVTFLYRADSI